MAGFRFPNETDEYRARRDALLDAEADLRAQTEAVAEQRRALPPGGRVDPGYRFEQLRDGDLIEVELGALFVEHSTLLLYSMMFGAGWDAPCPSCCSIVDAMNANVHPVTSHCAMAVVAAAEPDQLSQWADQRGWTLPLWSGRSGSYMVDYAGFETDNAALVSIMNVFKKTDEGIVHTWGSELLGRPMDNGHPRHVDPIWPLWNLLDMTPDGRGDAQIPKQDYKHEVFDAEVMGG